jgi:hypothetical protein
MRAVALLVAVAGCGRFGFGGTGTDAAATDDATDGAMGDALVGDAGPACLPIYDLCDGFEGAAIDTTTWLIDSASTLDSTRAHRGNNSVRVHSAAFAANTGSYVTIGETKTIAGSSTFWVRSWFWLSSLPAAGNGMELIAASSSGTGGDFVFVFADSTHLYTQYGTASWEIPTTVPVGSWFCVVFEVVRATTASGRLEMSGDVPTTVLQNVVTESASNPMSSINLGMGFANDNSPSAQPALDLWIDDVIVDGAPLTCAD